MIEIKISFTFIFEAPWMKEVDLNRKSMKSYVFIIDTRNILRRIIMNDRYLS